jgi:hypothetical protein
VIFGGAVGADEADGGFLLNVETDLIAKLEKGTRWRIMGSPDKIEIRLLGQERVPPVEVAGRPPAEKGVDVVAAGPAELDGAAVDEKLVPADFDFPKADPPDELLDHLASDLDFGRQNVEVGMLGVPEERLFERDVQSARRVLSGQLYSSGIEAKAGPIFIGQGKKDVGVSRGAQIHSRIDSQDRVPILGIQVRLDVKVGEVIRGKGQERDVAEDAGDEMMGIAASVGDFVVPVRDLDGQPGGFPRFDEVGDVAVPGGEASLMIPDELPVDPDAGVAVDAVEPQDDPSAREICRDIDLFFVGISDVMPDRKALHQALAGDFDIGPAGRIDILRPEVFRRSEIELPGPVQADDGALYSGDVVRRCGNIICPAARAGRQGQGDEQNRRFSDSQSATPGGWILEKANEVVNGFLAPNVSLAISRRAPCLPLMIK